MKSNDERMVGKCRPYCNYCCFCFALGHVQGSYNVESKVAMHFLFLNLLELDNNWHQGYRDLNPLKLDSQRLCFMSRKS